MNCSSVAFGAREEDVLADGAVEEERLLQHDAELLAIAREPDGGQIEAIDQDLPTSRGVEARR